MRKIEGYNNKQITWEDIKRLNKEERERVAKADNLFNSILKAENGDTSELQKQVYIKYSLIKGCLHGDIRFTEGRINNLAIRMKKRYANDEMVGGSTVRIGDNNFSATTNEKLLDEEDIDDMISNFIFNFNSRFIKVTENTSQNVPSIHSFKADSDEYSNNKLLNYLIGSDKESEKGMIEIALLKLIKHEKGTIRHMKNSKITNVNMNDLEVIGFEDITTPENEDGARGLIDDLIGEVDKNYIDEDDYDVFQPTKEMLFMKENLKNVLTKNQYEKFEELSEAIETKKTTFDKLLHPITSELVNAELGEIWYGRRSNVHKQIEELLKSMRTRMNQAIEKQNFKGESELYSSYRKLKNHSKKQNRLLSEYKILDKYVIKDIKIDDFHENINIKVKNDEQIIPYAEIEKIERHEQTVSDVIKKYQITKKKVENENGAIKRYVIDLEDGKPLFTEEELKKREDGHCRRLIEWIRYGDITFTYDEDTNLMKPNTHKLHSITPEDYYSLVERSLINFDDSKEIEIVRKNYNRDYFNTDNKYKLVEEYRVDIAEKKNVDHKDYNFKNTDFLEDTEIIDIDKLADKFLQSIDNIV